MRPAPPPSPRAGRRRPGRRRRGSPARARPATATIAADRLADPGQSGTPRNRQTASSRSPASPPRRSRKARRRGRFKLPPRAQHGEGDHPKRGGGADRPRMSPSTMLRVVPLPIASHGEDRAPHSAESFTIRPSCISSTRPQRAASAGSWVMTSKVAPVSALPLEQQVEDRARRSRRRDCRSARRRRAEPGAARWRGRWRRAAARRPTAARDNGSGGGRGRPLRARRRRVLERVRRGRPAPAAPRHSPARSSSAAGGRPGGRCRSGRAGPAPDRPRPRR